MSLETGISYLAQGRTLQAIAELAAEAKRGIESCARDLATATENEAVAQAEEYKLAGIKARLVPQAEGGNEKAREASLNVLLMTDKNAQASHKTAQDSRVEAAQRRIKADSSRRLARLAEVTIAAIGGVESGRSSR